MLLVFFSFLFSLNAFTQSTAEWIDTEWELLPRAAKATKPSPLIPISSSDRAGISLKNNDVARNTYLLASYREIASNLHACLKVPMGNWYHFAYFANRTSGEFISGKRFDEMDWLTRELLDIMGWHKLIPNEEEMIKLFAFVNFTIGIEMVPHGRYFYESFCQGSLPSFDTFSSKLEGGDLARSELIRGYEQYYLSLLENDPKLKLERVALGTSLLMMGEQRRAQINVNALFRFGNEDKGPVEFFYRWHAAATTGLELNQDTVIPFNKDVTIKYMGKLRVTLDDYKKLHQEHGLSLAPHNGKFKKSAVFDWGNLDQRLRFLVAVVRGHSERKELILFPHL